MMSFSGQGSTQWTQFLTLATSMFSLNIASGWRPMPAIALTMQPSATLFWWESITAISPSNSGESLGVVDNGQIRGKWHRADLIAKTQPLVLGNQVPSKNLTSEDYGERLQLVGQGSSPYHANDTLNYWYAFPNRLSVTWVIKKLFFTRPHWESQAAGRSMPSSKAFPDFPI